jgi:Zn-dependent peptidase ImmA (M78 family)
VSRTPYYQELRALALEKRREYGVATADISLSTLRRIYKLEHIQIDFSDAPVRKMKAAYFCEDGDASVLIKRRLPEIPRLFALAHELKHHLCDRDELMLCCWDITNRSPVIEIGAEEFAAEFIYPLEEFVELLGRMDIDQGHCTAERVVDFKRICPAKVSYTNICKRLERLGAIQRGAFQQVQFQKLEDALYGVPFYRR